jgi:hypothetical protein
MYCNITQKIAFELYAFYAFYALGFIFRNRGPLQKVCRDPDTHASPQLPPGAALGCFLDEKYLQLPSFYLPSLQGTKYARYIGISNIFICLRSFLLFSRCFSLLPPFLYAQRTLPRLSRLPGGAAVGHKIDRV